MSTYIIGDIQGCFDELKDLLEKINFQTDKDKLIFVGDLVNRGPKSFEILEFIYHLPNKKIVLGNHDLYLINLFYGALPRSYKKHTLDKILDTPQSAKMIEWLRHQPLIYKDDQQKYFVVHAGIPPQWSIDETQKYSQEICDVLQGKNFKSFLENMFGNEPKCWNKSLKGFDRLRYIINALTRLRFCDGKGCLDPETTSRHATLKDYKPWFDWPNESFKGYDIYFGHWAALQGECDVPNIHALDTGCVWGGTLTAINIETKEKFKIKSAHLTI